MKKILIVFSIIFHLSSNVYSQEFKLEKIVDGLDEPWSLSFIDDENIIFTEKPGKLYSLNLKNKKISEIKHDLNFLEYGQGGLLDVLYRDQYVYISYSENRGNWTTSTSVAKGKLNQDNIQFKKSVYNVCGIKNVINYYGMVEQTGSIFLECSEGYLHSSIFSDIIIRRNDFSVCDFNEIGLVQLISLLPKSYPGHNIISEDLGQIIGIDDCKCGRLGKYFVIHGRAERAEIRGCSDTVE